MLKNDDENNVNIIKDDINIINAQNEKKIDKKTKKNNPYYLFFTFVLKRMKSDKLYLFSFIITLIFVIVFSIYNICEAEGLYKVDSESKLSDKKDSVVVHESSDELDIKDYIGIYSKEVILDEPLMIDNTCSIDSYKITYQIKKDKSITKYFVNKCIGVVEIWSDKLSYVSTGGARYINANNINYLFASSSMKEVDGDTFTIDDDLSNMKAKIVLEGAEIYFEEKNIIILTNNNLYLVDDGVGTNILKDYQSNGGELQKKVYKSDIKRQFNFIKFSNEESLNCYDNTLETFVDGPLYDIYSIKYNTNTNSFNNPSLVISRNKSVGCEVFKDDIELLKE